MFKWLQGFKKPKHKTLFRWKNYDIRGVTLGWGGQPVVMFDDGKIFSMNFDRYVFKDFYPNGADWPHHPETGEKLPIAKEGS